MQYYGIAIQCKQLATCLNAMQVIIIIIIIINTGKAAYADGPRGWSKNADRRTAFQLYIIDYDPVNVTVHEYQIVH